jgi:hypothetical protein
LTGRRLGVEWAVVERAARPNPLLRARRARRTSSAKEVAPMGRNPRREERTAAATPNTGACEGGCVPDTR